MDDCQDWIETSHARLDDALQHLQAGDTLAAIHQLAAAISALQVAVALASDEHP